MSFYFMTLVLRTIPIGITHAVWSGTGIVLIVVAGTIIYKQIPDIPAIIGMVLIILGVAVIHFFIKKPFIIKFDELELQIPLHCICSRLFALLDRRKINYAHL